MADYVPALKARMGDWQYYVTVMKLGKIAKECHLANEIHSNKDLDDLIINTIKSSSNALSVKDILKILSKQHKELDKKMLNSRLYSMKNKNIFNIVFSSTCAIFGTPDRMPVSEDLGD